MTERKVLLEGGVPWGFRMHGGVDSNSPLRVSRVNPGSKASQRGIREGDLITSINNESTTNLNNSEAHNLLKRCGSNLELGLNEKSQYRTIHQETHQEVVKRSSYSYSTKETKESTDNELGAFKVNEFINGQETKQNGGYVTVVTNVPVSQHSTSSSSSTSTPSTLIAEGKHISSDHALASRQSSYSNCSSIPDEGTFLDTSEEMNDHGMSKSARRRQRRKNLLTKTTQHHVEIREIEPIHQPINLVLEPQSENLEILRLKRIEHKYRVESPKELTLEHVKIKDKKLKIKSKSLDDDDNINIQELSEASDVEDGHMNVVISEASSEENLLSDTEEAPKRRSSLHSISLTLNDDNQIEVSHISPAEEHELRSFLGSLNLVNSAEESAKDLYERTNVNDTKAKKLEKRRQLEEYFVPIAQNPRYLDAISEEASDISDKECGRIVDTPLVICNSRIDGEKAEVVFLDDSSSISSQSTVDCEESSEEATRQLTPPSTPDGIGKSKTVFDYTKIPNVLTEKEPEGVTSKKTVERIFKKTGESTEIINTAVIARTGDTKEVLISSKVPGVGKSSLNVDQPEISMSKVTVQSKVSMNGIKSKDDVGLIETTETDITVEKIVDDSETKEADSVSTNGELSSSRDVKIIKTSVMLDPEHPAKSSQKIVDGETFNKSTEFEHLIKIDPPLLPNSKSLHSDVVSKNEHIIKIDQEKVPQHSNLLKREVENGEPDKIQDIINKERTDTMEKETSKTIEHIIKIEKETEDLAEERSTVSSSDTTHMKSIDIVVKNGEDKYTKIIKIETDKGNNRPLFSKLVNGEKEHIIKIEKVTNKDDLHSKVVNGKKEHIIKIEKETLDDDHKKNFPSRTIDRLVEVQKNRNSTMERNIATKKEPEDLAVERSKVCSSDVVIKNGEDLNNRSTQTEHIIKIEKETDKIVDALSHKEESNSTISSVVVEKSEEVDNKKTEHIIKIEKETDKDGGKKEHIIKIEKENSLLQSETKSETLLKHMIMSTNKTDSQKILEFESIKKLNDELKDKISKQELIGPLFRKSRSPADAIVMRCHENSPSKNLIQQRIRQFSEQNGYVPYQPERITTFDDESVLKRLIGEGKEKVVPIEREQSGIFVSPNGPVVLAQPPVPPPRRSKASLLKTREDSEIPESSDMTYMNVISPSRPASASSDSTCSEQSSRCTAKYNPDVTSIEVYDVPSLRSIVLRVLMGLPYGEVILRELAEMSKDLAYRQLSNNVDVSAPTMTHRLLTIIQEEPAETQSTLLSQTLQARNLNEWLTLARHKSKSTSNLDCTNIPINNLSRNVTGGAKSPDTRRRSLPKEIYEKQLISIMEKERDIQRELEQLEEEKRKLQAEMGPSRQKQFQVDEFYVSKKGDFAERREDLEKKERPVSMPVFPTEFFRQQMYEEYMDKFCERKERKQQKVIKISSSNDLDQVEKKSEIVHPVEIEKEFMDKVREKLKTRQASEDDEVLSDQNIDVLVLDGDKVKAMNTLPRHLQEFVDLVQTDDDSIWSPNQPRRPPSPPSKHYQRTDSQRSVQSQNDPQSPIWTPKSANSSPTLERKEFRPVNFQSPVLSRKTRTRSESIPTPDSITEPWKADGGSETLERRLPTSQSTPGFGSFSPRLPRAQNPTITLLQKAREGQLPKGAQYIDRDRRPPNDRPPIKYPGEVLFNIKNEYTSESDSEKPRKMADLTPRKFEGIGPVSKDGMPLILRSEVKDKDQSKWYKRMYDTIHKQKPHRDEYLTVRYKQKRGQYPYSSGYLSEPEPGAYDSDFSEYKYQTLDRRRTPPTQHYINNQPTMSRTVPEKSYSSSDIVKNTPDKYLNSPGRIENYRPGHSSISEKEAKKWWDEVMDIFDGHLEQQSRMPPQKPRSFINQALKESGYESDSTLVFKRKEETAASHISPKEQKEAYKMIQKGGDVPFQGLRKPAPERPKETDLVEFVPISPTLTKIRIHKSILPNEFVCNQQYFCYPATSKPFPTFKKFTPSVKLGIPTPPPSPPKRRSSRNNSTLRLISTMKTDKSPICKRHETCFTSGPNVDRTKVLYLKDKLSHKLSPLAKRKVDSPKLTARKVVASPELKRKTAEKKPQAARSLYKSGSTGSISKESLSSRTSTPVRTRKLDLALPSTSKSKLSKTTSEELISPTEVKKAMKNLTSVQYKESAAPLASGTKALPIKVGFTERGKNILRSSLKKLSPRISRKPAAAPDLKLVKKSNIKPKTQDKFKKNMVNDTIKSKTPSPSLPRRPNPVVEEIAKQKQAMESNHFFRNLFLRNSNIKHSASFSLPKNSWVVERTNQLTRKKLSLNEPSIGAMKIYLKHTKPVSDSKFISLDSIRSRSASPKSVTFSDNVGSKRSKSLPSKLVLSQTSRPVSRRSPILKTKDLVTIRRSPSPPRMIFSQTSRPVSPMITKKPTLSLPIRRSPSPQQKLYFSETTRPISPEVRRNAPVSPLIPRSPSCRKIMQIRQHKPPELTLYACPELKHSSTSLDSFRSEDYQVYMKDLDFGVESSKRFKDLNHFYNDIEKVGQLEKISAKPRRLSEHEIIDYDRWMEVRKQERAEHELKHLYNHLKSHEKEKGFLFLPKDVEQYKWRRELDRGLRIKEKSVENIKWEFERLKREDSERESARRREISLGKDVYKPLWRGNSVVNLASLLTERRSQSEGRVKTARQKLLDNESHGIGSRVWSSLSMEQVTNLKKQLQDIYGDEQVKPPLKSYVVEVPKQAERRYIPKLTVRRNSESSNLMSEDEKKVISQTLSREVLEKISNKRKEDKLALPLVVGKEVLGARATEEAHVKPQKPLVKTDAVTTPKHSFSETESASTDESTKTVINLKDVQQKVEYFEKAKEQDVYVPTVYKPNEDLSSTSEEAVSPTEKFLTASKSAQDLKEYFGETELVKFATLPLSATRKSDFHIKKPLLRATDISPIRTISETNSMDSLTRSRSASPYCEEARALAKKGEVKKLKRQFEFFEDFFGEKLKRSRSENDLRTYGHVDDLRRKYEYPVHSGRGRSRVKRGGMVSPVWLRAEDRYMPHINIISKIASLYSFSKHKEASKSMEELAEILGCPVGEVEKMKEKFDKMHDDEISLMGRMYTSSPNLKELRDITPYLTANWIAHKYPRGEDNTRSLSSPDTSIASRDTSLVRRDRAKKLTSTRYTKEPEIPPPPPPPKSLGRVRSQESESPRKYVENEVTIHYKTPVRTEIKEYVSEDELAHRQAEAMKKIYEEERKRKYLQVSDSEAQELQDMKSRRHTDNFIPSQKSPIPLNRYDDFDDLAPSKTRTRSPDPRLVAKALYNFVGQTARELTFRKGDLIYVRRQVDKNWYEGELNAMIGLFPVNYVEIVPYEGKTTIRKAHEGQARAKFNFVAQTHLELSLAKGELVTITRRVDDNWFEGKIGGRKGIFPVSYVEVLIDPSDPLPPSTKPVASPAAHSLLLNGSAQGKESMGSHQYRPNLPNPITHRNNGYHHAKPVQLSGGGTYSTLPKSSKSPIEQTLHIETQTEPIPYRALYKYTPQNDDELELLEGDTVYVLEKCDDGWYVGSSDRTGAFGTFPGNYVEKI